MGHCPVATAACAPYMTDIVRARRSIARLLVATTIALLATAAHALGGDGGCTYDRSLMDAASNGSPSELARRMEAAVARAWSATDPDARTLLSSSSRALQEWQAYAKGNFLNKMGRCGEDRLMDRAISGGNLEVVDWLLDQGADPSVPGSSGESVFERCPAARPGPGLDEAEADRHTAEAYRHLIARGANKNRIYHVAGGDPPLNALAACSKPKMLQLLLDLGFDRSPQEDGPPALHGPLQEKVRRALHEPRLLDDVRVLAQGGFNDLRGTRVETQLFEWCRDASVVEVCRQLQPLLQVNPGIWPESVAPMPVDPPAQAFGAHRETCSFPELQFLHGDLELAAVSEGDERHTGVRLRGSDDEARLVEVIVNSPDRPALLYLYSDEPRIWSIRMTPGTRILGAVLSRPEPGMVLGLPAATPVAQAYCRVVARPGVAPFKPVTRPTLDPFERGLPIKQYGVRRGPTVVGEPLSPQALASLPPLPAIDVHAPGLAPFPKPSSPPLQGRSAFEAMVADGRLQRADAGSFLWWFKTMRENPWYRRHTPSSVPPFWDGYANFKVTLDLPPGLRGSDAPVVFTSADTHFAGDVGDATLFFTESRYESERAGTCKGPLC